MNMQYDDMQQSEAAHELNDEEEETPGGCILAHSMVRLSNKPDESANLANAVSRGSIFARDSRRCILWRLGSAK